MPPVQVGVVVTYKVHCAAGESLGKIGTKEALEVLLRTCRRQEDAKADGDKTFMPPLQIGANVGLQLFGSSQDNALKTKARVELQVLAETDEILEVRVAARAALDAIMESGQKKRP